MSWYVVLCYAMLCCMVLVCVIKSTNTHTHTIIICVPAGSGSLAKRAHRSGSPPDPPPSPLRSSPPGLGPPSFLLGVGRAMGWVRPPRPLPVLSPLPVRAGRT